MKRSVLMRVDPEFEIEMRGLRRTLGGTYPKITKRLVKPIRRFKRKYIIKTRKDNSNEMGDILEECFKI